MQCDECGGTGAVHTTASGRVVCDDCYRRLAQLTGAVTGLSGGGSVADAVATGIAVGGFAGATDPEVDAIRARKTKLAATSGFWRRLYVRVIG